ncbi:GFA family protein [Caballeronia sp. SEWSISQ10-4 2]|uniref:GFA family protein n=1 Tax=Caballeronia sp. SEWSISQ10-4 2 TaxID=2937438 RepID=UPI0026535CD7|nr:GFA family protein [Caballeronia sp. SEWSISQ10-4 2]MDN7183132.1 GFA family protein [Caballeronia sp. SEWSISQ10-4 2]
MKRPGFPHQYHSVIAGRVRRRTPAAYAATARVLREHFHWTSGESLLRSFESSPGKLRYFCSECGTHLIAERPEQARVILRVQTLDEDPGVTPAMHIWISHDQPWMSENSDIPWYSEWPPAQ